TQRGYPCSMILRRELHWMQFGMAVALPLFVLVTRGIIADGVGWQLIVYLVLCPILFVALLGLSGLIVARREVRESRTVSWLDAAVLLVIWAGILTYGLFAYPLMAAVVVLAIVAGFWAGLWQLFSETKTRV